MHQSAAQAATPKGILGPAHVATVSFLASRAVPSGGFWVALAGGTALARVAQRHGARHGYGASMAGMLETVAIMGPARLSIPLTQAVTAPMLGRLEARSLAVTLQVLACTAVRMFLNSLGAAFFIWVVAGGLDAYAGSYDAIAGWFGFTVGERGTLLVTAAGLLAWGLFASVVQVLVYRRALSDWPELAGDDGVPPAAPGALAGRFDPRAVALAAGVAFALLLASTDWVLLGAVAGWLGAAWVLSRPDRSAVPTGLVLAAVLGGGALLFTLGGGLGLDLALRRSVRAVLLVLVATWLRAAAGAAGLREVSRRALGKVRRLPAAPEAARVLDQIGSEGRLAAAGRALVDALRDVERQPVPLLDAVLRWVAEEAARFRAGDPPPRLALQARVRDAALVATAVAPAVVLAL